jgi:hypothetical protein
LLAVGSFTLIAPASAMSAQFGKEVAAAAAHAGYAAGSEDLAGVRAHLQHTINCIVGPDGEGFDKKQMNPCAALGNGALADTSEQGQTSALKAALGSAKEALAEEDLAKAKAGATATQSMLLAIKE